MKDVGLGQRSQHKASPLAKRDTTGNARLANYFSDYITIVSNSTLRFCLKPFDLFPYLRDNSWRDLFNSTYYEVYTAQGERPLRLRLREGNRAHGWEALQALGMPRAVWFACFHWCERCNYLKDDESQNYSYSDIVSYRIAMQEIVNHGG